MENRKAFNFYRSYYDVVNELPVEDRLSFLMAILDKQFNNLEPQLTGLSKFAYISQKHAIDAQVDGYISKTKNTPTEPPTIPPTIPPTEPPLPPPTESPYYVSNDSVMTTEPPTEPPTIPPSVQEKEKEKEQEQEQEQEQEKVYSSNIIKNKFYVKGIEFNENEIEEDFNYVNDVISPSTKEKNVEIFNVEDCL